MTWVAPVFWMLVGAATLTGLRASSATSLRHRPRTSSVVLWLVVALPALVQMWVPSLLGVLGRDWGAISSGQLWRLLTSVVVQDGGVGGTLFGLLSLAAVLYGAEGCWSAPRIWVVFWAGALGSNLVVGPWLAPVGAGDSMATLLLACALVSQVVVAVRPPGIRPMAALLLVGCCLLVVARDYHAVACVIGLAAGVSLGVVDRRRSERTPQG